MNGRAEMANRTKKRTTKRKTTASGEELFTILVFEEQHRDISLIRRAGGYSSVADAVRGALADAIRQARVKVTQE